MEVNTTNATAWELDSRTAAFQRNKRPRDLTISDDLSSSGSANSTPRKRARRIGKFGHQDVRDFVPLGASFSSTPTPLDEQVPSEDEAIHVEPSLGDEGLRSDDPSQSIAAQPLQDVQNGITASEDDRLGSPVPGDTKVSVSGVQTLPSHDHTTNEDSTNEGNIFKDEHALGEEKEINNKLGHKIGNMREPTSPLTSPIAWNPVNNIKIRTKLGGNSHKEAVEQVEQAVEAQASGAIREKGQ